MEDIIFNGSNILKTFNIDLNYPELDIWVDFLHIYQYKPNETFSFHAHPNIELHYYASGEGEIAFIDDKISQNELFTMPATVKSKSDPSLLEYRFEKDEPNKFQQKIKLFKVKEGSVFFNSPGQFCWQKSSENNPLVEYAMRFTFKIKKADHPVNSHFLKEHKLILHLLSQSITKVLNDTGEIKTIYETIFKEAYFKKPAFLNKIKNEMINLIIAYSRLAWDYSKYHYFIPEIDNVQKRLSMIDDYIQSNLGVNITIEQLAKNVNMSKRNLCRFIKDRKGVSPHQYIMQLKILKAVHLVKLKTRTLTEVAYLTGFSSSFHLSKCIKKYTGKNPTEL